MSAPFARFAETAERVRSTSSTLAKANALAELLRELDDEDLAIACRLFAGAPFASADQRVLGIGWSAIIDIVLELSRAGEGELSTSYQKHADVGDVTAELLAAHDWQSESPPLTFADLAAAFERIASTRGAVAKREILESLMRRATSLEAKYLVKIVTGEMRIGLRAGLLEGAIAKGTGAPKAKVARAAMLTGDVGETAVRARRGTLDETRLHLFHPLGWMLATPVLELGEVAKRFPPPYLVEDKYDGVRVQVHKEGARVEIYSRTLDAVTHRFPELLDPIRALPGAFILDGEVLGWRRDRAIPFVQFQRRLGRKNVEAELQQELPVALFAFDILAENGDVLLDVPLADRRTRLSRYPFTAPLYLSRSETLEVAEAELSARLDALFVAARDRGNEGLMVKDPRSPYRAGRRGMEWLKVKRALRTLDVVVTGVEWGHGKRHGVLSDYTFAVLDGDRLLDVGKAYSGLTDEEIADMTKWFLDHTVRDLGRFRAVEPTQVIEVAFDNVQRSNRHPSGYALRFPRIVRLRPDKPLTEIDTLDTVREIAKAGE
ncbi:MAG: hypothetical protein AUH85_13710 [Chloroflexi bacterium 13_1_40CM_4_68_4]|nr:MAG: hypothetical protein AUH85_13710 [Chloroflexi bacterium 13_1_40CM_4_68_4]